MEELEVIAICQAKQFLGRIQHFFGRLPFIGPLCDLKVFATCQLRLLRSTPHQEGSRGECGNK
ncbi:Uncharacterised protein [Bordetella pertussis]|nr:Uncharacterised protein [Bordetella pertussis]